MAAPTKKKLSAGQQLRIRRASRRREPDPAERGGELNIVPFLDVVVNLMLFLLATTAATTVAMAQSTASTPGLCRGHCERGEPGLGLSVTVLEEGLVVAGRDGRLAPGCEGTTGASGPTIPRGLAGQDFDALRACLVRVHARFPDEREVVLSADPSVRYEALIGAMDAARGDADAPLFTDVRLSAGVR